MYSSAVLDWFRGDQSRKYKWYTCKAGITIISSDRTIKDIKSIWNSIKAYESQRYGCSIKYCIHRLIHITSEDPIGLIRQSMLLLEVKAWAKIKIKLLKYILVGILQEVSFIILQPLTIIGIKKALSIVYRVGYCMRLVLIKLISIFRLAWRILASSSAPAIFWLSSCP